MSKDLYKELDFSRFESNMEKSYLTDNFQEYESDMVIKVGWRESDIYIYLLMEFQSTTEEYMPLRFLNYWTLFHMDASIDKKTRKIKDGKLPPTLPILIYSGKEKWHSPHEIHKIVRKCEFIDQYTPSFKYFPIIINTFNKRSLVKIRNAVSALFLFENSLTEQELKANLAIIVDIIARERPEVATLIRVWFEHLLKNQKVDSTIYDEIGNVMKRSDTDMLETIKIWEKNLLKKGEVRGKAIGEAIGEARGEACSLLKILKFRFGSVPDNIEKEILSVHQKILLDEAIDVALDATDIDQVISTLKK